MKFIVSLFFLVVTNFLFAKDSNSSQVVIDSLVIELESVAEDDVKYQIISNIGFEYLNVDYDKAYDYSIQAYNYSANGLNIEIRKKASYTLGHIFNSKGAYSVAINYFIECDDLSRETQDTLQLILCKNGLGNLHLGYNHFEQALEHYTSANILSKVFNDEPHVGITYMGMGNAEAALGNNEKAVEYFEASKKICSKDKSPFIYASILANQAKPFAELGNIDLALSTSFESLEIMTAVNHGYGIAAINQEIGSFYKLKRELNLALEFYLIAIDKYLEIGNLSDLQMCYFDVSEIYEELDNSSLAYAYVKKHVELKDSLFNEKNSEIVAEMQNKYDQEINNNKIALLNKESQIREVKLKTKENQQLYLYVGLFVVLLFSGFIFNRYKISNRQKNSIEIANKTLNETNVQLALQRDEILASITYAKRIQNAILPQNKVIKEHLKESFILYKPKDIVAGDFYWLEKTGDKVFFAVADCTGHGVPGAMVSVICNNALNRSVREHRMTSPGKILDKSTDIVIEEFEKSDEEVKDGMDIALCSIEGTKLKYAGAHNPLWIIRNGVIIETKGDKQPIGKFDNRILYTTHSFDLQKGDSIYIFTDGFVDQFGGVKGKKFKVKAFRELLLSIQDSSMELQKIVIDETFEKWKQQNFEQVDDVCVMGVRI
jgi:serine phosphatase RsbU (regulator of sigma subunit)